MANEKTEKNIEEILRKQNNAIEKQIQLEEKLVAHRKGYLGQLEKESRVQAKRIKFQEDELKNLETALALGKEKRKSRADSLAAQLQELEIDKQRSGISAKESRDLTEKIGKLKTSVEENEKILNLSDEQLKTEVEIKKEKLEQEKLDAKATESNRKLVDSTKDYLGQLTGVTDQWKQGSTFTNAMLSAINDATDASGGLLSVVKSIGAGFRETFNLQNVGASMINAVKDATKELIVEQDKAIAEFKTSTGLNGEYTQSLVDVQVEMKHLGVQTGDVMESFQSLSAANSTFVFENKAVRDSLLETTTAFDAAYGAADGAAATIAVFQTTLGMTAGAAEQAALDLSSAALAMKKEPAAILAEFAELGPQLAAWGPDTQKVFLETAAAAKALHLQTSELLSIAGGFDTFKDAAGKVGQLNAALGGDYFDTMEMVMATEEERVKMIKDGLEASGRSFSEMGRFERKRLAEAAGMTVEQLGKITGANKEMYEELQRLQSDSTMSYNDLSDAAQKNMSLEEKQEAIKRSLAISMRPLIELQLKLAGALQTVMEFLGPTGGMIVTVTGIVIFFGAKLAILAGEMGLIGPAAAPASHGLRALGQAAATLTAAAPAIPVLLSIAAVFVSIGLAAVGVGYGLSLAISSIVDMVSATAKLASALAGLEIDKLKDMAGIDLSMSADLETTRVVKDTLVAASNLTPENIENVKQVSDHLIRLTAETADLGNVAIINAINNMFKDTAAASATAGGAQASAATEVVLEVDGARLGKILMPYVEKATRPNVRVT